MNIYIAPYYFIIGFALNIVITYAILKFPRYNLKREQKVALNIYLILLICNILYNLIAILYCIEQKHVNLFSSNSLITVYDLFLYSIRKSLLIYLFTIIFPFIGWKYLNSTLKLYSSISFLLIPTIYSFIPEEYDKIRILIVNFIGGTEYFYLFFLSIICLRLVRKKIHSNYLDYTFACIFKRYLYYTILLCIFEFIFSLSLGLIHLYNYSVQYKIYFDLLLFTKIIYSLIQFKAMEYGIFKGYSPTNELLPDHLKEPVDEREFQILEDELK